MPKHSDPTTHTVLSVAVPSPLRRLFDYLPAPKTTIEHLRPGLRLAIPFGHQKSLVGILISVTQKSIVSKAKLRPIHGVIDHTGLNQEILSLCQWCANYYHYPLGETCHLALPALLRKAVPAPEKATTPAWILSTQGKEYDKQSFGRAKKQCDAWQLAMKHPLLTTDIIKQAGLSRSVVNALVSKGLLEETTQASTPLQPQTVQAPLPLNEEQATALESIDLTTFGCYLLDGVTGSGKTEVYLQAIAKVIAAGNSALVLVPEIGLTPQTVERFRRRFHQTPIATLHSGMSDKQRYDAWVEAQEQKATIIIGTRSAIFTPLQALGLIIVDEEHDLSYKQQEGVRYSARDVAIIRAQKNNIPIILGSATPSLETLHNALSGRFQHLPLRHRATATQLPIIRCVNQPQADLAPEIIKAIRDTLQKQQQALVFINRRGYAPTLICQDCGWISQCQHCDSRMTVHYFQQQNQHLHCHHCDRKTALPVQCPHCHSEQIQVLGQGTQRSEEELRQHFTQIPILRIDRDSMSRKGELEAAFSTINSGQPCILIGTQMLAKGHHFSNVSLAVILGLDNSFFSSDFRGAERMGQLLTQVAGRAGREEHQGLVLLQTQFADHPQLQLLITQGYSALGQQLLPERQLTGMPPFQHMVLLRCHAQQPTMAMQFLQQARALAETIQAASPELQYLGPLPAAIEKRNNRYYYQLQIKSTQRKPLHQLLTQLCLQLEQQRQPKGLHWLVDVDPQ